MSMRYPEEEEDEDDRPLRLRKKARRTVIGSDDDEEYAPGPSSRRKSVTPDARTNRRAPIDTTASNPTPSIIKPEPQESDGDDFYASPEPQRDAAINPENSQAPAHALQASRSNTSEPANQLLREAAADDSDVEMMEAPRKEFKVPTTFNDAIANSDDPDRKPFAHELIQAWRPYDIPLHDLILAPQMFTRKFLSDVLGGSSQNERCRPAAGKQQRQIELFGKVLCTYYGCEKSDWNPHMPKRMGHHGLVYFAGHKSELGDDESVRKHNHDYNDGLLPVFCCRAPNNWEYCGDYQLTTRRFVPGEYEAVPEATKQIWSNWYSASGKWSSCGGLKILRELGLIGPEEVATAEDVRRMLDTGAMVMEAVTYECKGFNKEMYIALLKELEKRKDRGEVEIKTEDKGDN